MAQMEHRSTSEVTNTCLIFTIIQMQPPRAVLKKRYSKNMQKIYRRTPMPKCDFSKVALQLY